MSLRYRGAMTSDFIRHTVDQSQLPRAVFDFRSGELLYRNEAFSQICEPPNINGVNDLLDRLLLENSETVSMSSLQRMVGSSVRSSEHLGALRINSGESRWVWLHFEIADDDNDTPAYLSVYLYLYYSGPPPLSVTSEPTSLGSAREYLSHDLNSMFMALHLAVENLRLTEPQTQSLSKILKSAQRRKDDLIERLLALAEHPENIREAKVAHSATGNHNLQENMITSNLNRLARQFAVLVVEDDEDLLQHIRAGLVRRGHRCVAVESGNAAMAAVDDGFTPDVALVDLRLGDEDGRVVCDKLRTRVPHMEVVFMTGFANWAAVASLESQRRVLRKPFSVSYLESTIHEVLELNLANRSGNQRSDRPTTKVAGRTCDQLIGDLGQAMFDGYETPVLNLVSNCFSEGTSLLAIYASLVVPAWESLSNRTAGLDSQTFKLHRARWLIVRAFSGVTSLLVSDQATKGTVVIGGPEVAMHSGYPRRLLAEILRSQGFFVSDIGFTPSPTSLISACLERDDLVAVCLGPWTIETHRQTCDAVDAVRSTFGPRVKILVGGALTPGSDVWHPANFQSIQQMRSNQVIDGCLDDYVLLAELFDS